MADYKEIKGFKWQSVSSDPSNPVLGQVWYNSTSPGTLKYRGFNAASWSTGGSLGTARYGAAGFGSEPAAVGCFGYGPTYGVATEEYNGSSWTAGNNGSTPRYQVYGCGVLTAGLVCGGSIDSSERNQTEEYDGTNWSNGGNYPAAHRLISLAGTQTATLGAGGSTPTPGSPGQIYYDTHNQYDGSSWTSSTAMPGTRGYAKGIGVQTAALVVGGGLGPTAGTVTNTSLEWNGSSWTSGGTLGANLSTMGGGGSQTAAIAFGNTTQCSLYDGSSFTTTTSMSLGGDSSAGTGTTTSAAAALNFLRRPAPADNRKATEEFTEAAAGTKSITTS
tara:strand:+ start:452 stop:1447 length:996 start_codon:yes stop_codon:yes gene_type:complete